MQLATGWVGYLATKETAQQAALGRLVSLESALDSFLNVRPGVGAAEAYENIALSINQEGASKIPRGVSWKLALEELEHGVHIGSVHLAGLEEREGTVRVLSAHEGFHLSTVFKLLSAEFSAREGKDLQSFALVFGVHCAHGLVSAVC